MLGLFAATTFAVNCDKFNFYLRINQPLLKSLSDNNFTTYDIESKNKHIARWKTQHLVSGGTFPTEVTSNPTVLFYNAANVNPGKTSAGRCRYPRKAELIVRNGGVRVSCGEVNYLTGQSGKRGHDKDATWTTCKDAEKYFTIKTSTSFNDDDDQ